MYVRFFTYVKNEITMIEEWLNYHSQITKPYLIHVVDNGSTDGTLDVLNHYKHKRGINVYHHDDYTLKGEFLSSLMIKYKNQPGLLIPLDGDEFMTLYFDNKLTNNVDRIIAHLKQLPKNSGVYKTRGTLFSVPEKEVNENPFEEITKWRWKWNTDKMRKVFFNNRGFKQTDHGNHNGKSELEATSLTNIVLLHYHDIGRRAYKLKCEQDSSGLGLNLDVLKSQLAEPGQNKGSSDYFAGVEKVNAYVNMNNWKYEPVDKADVIFKWTDE